MSFSGIALRTNGPNSKIDKDWFNSLRAAGILIENYLGTFIGETSFTIANNQSSAANVTGLAFAPVSIGGFTVEYRIYRNTTSTGATELSEYGTLMGTYSPVAGTWELTQNNVGNAGVTFTITNGGQVQYTSTDITGTPDASTMKFKARSISI